MPHAGQGGSWRGWWEGVVDLTTGDSRDVTLERLFKKGIPRAFPEAESSILRVVGEGFHVQPDSRERRERLDGEERTVHEWDLLAAPPKDIKVYWDEPFQHRKSPLDPLIQLSPSSLHLYLSLAVSSTPSLETVRSMSGSTTQAVSTVRLCTRKYGHGG